MSTCKPTFSTFPLLLLLLILTPIQSSLLAQDTLTVSDAIQKALEHNYDIRIAQNEARIPANNATYGNAGFLPELTLSGSLNERVEDTESEYQSNAIPDQTIDDAETTVSSASANLSWTLFDGFKMFTTYKRLQKMKAQGELQARLAVENTLSEVITSYYNLASLQKTLAVLDTTLEVSRERIQIAETKKELGSGSRYDLLQARADLNADKAAYLKQEELLKENKVAFNRLIGMPIDQDYAVSREMPFSNNLMLQPLIEQAMDQNFELSLLRLEQKIAALEVDELKANRYPSLDLNLGYQLSQTESSGQFLSRNESQGYNYGLSLRYTLFDGFNNRRQVENASIALKTRKLVSEDAEKQLRTSVVRWFTKYEKARERVQLEEENLVYARESLQIAIERFDLGTINAVELREAQRTFIQAENRLITARFEAKLAETELMRLSGNISRDIPQ